ASDADRLLRTASDGNGRGPRGCHSPPVLYDRPVGEAAAIQPSAQPTTPSLTYPVASSRSSHSLLLTATRSRPAAVTPKASPEGLFPTTLTAPGTGTASKPSAGEPIHPTASASDA